MQGNQFGADGNLIRDFRSCHGLRRSPNHNCLSCLVGGDSSTPSLGSWGRESCSFQKPRSALGMHPLGVGRRSPVSPHAQGCLHKGQGLRDSVTERIVVPDYKSQHQKRRSMERAVRPGDGAMQVEERLRSREPFARTAVFPWRPQQTRGVPLIPQSQLHGETRGEEG